jgi:hypothetical protein
VIPTLHIGLNICFLTDNQNGDSTGICQFPDLPALEAQCESSWNSHVTDYLSLFLDAELAVDGLVATAVSAALVPTYGEIVAGWLTATAVLILLFIGNQKFIQGSGAAGCAAIYYTP